MTKLSPHPMKLSPHPMYPQVKMDNQLYSVRVQSIEPAVRLFPIVAGLVGFHPLVWGTKAFEGEINKSIKPVIQSQN